MVRSDILRGAVINNKKDHGTKEELHEYHNETICTNHASMCSFAADAQRNNMGGGKEA